MSLVDKSNSDRVLVTMLDLNRGQAAASSVRDAHADFRGNGLGTGHEVLYVVPRFSVRDRDGSVLARALSQIASVLQTLAPAA